MKKLTSGQVNGSIQCSSTFTAQNYKRGISLPNFGVSVCDVYLKVVTMSLDKALHILHLFSVFTFPTPNSSNCCSITISCLLPFQFCLNLFVTFSKTVSFLFFYRVNIFSFCYSILRSLLNVFIFSNILLSSLNKLEISF